MEGARGKGTAADGGKNLIMSFSGRINWTELSRYFGSADGVVVEAASDNPVETSWAEVACVPLLKTGMEASCGWLGAGCGWLGDRWGWLGARCARLGASCDSLGASCGRLEASCGWLGASCVRLAASCGGLEASCGWLVAG